MNFTLKFTANNIRYIMDNNSPRENTAITLITDSSGLKVTAIPHTTITDIEFCAVLPYEFNKDDLFYSNGFQSWSLSREYRINERYESYFRMVKPILSRIGALKIGDYDFVPYPHRKGVFNSSAHCYIRRKGSSVINLYGSLDDSNGYTTFIADTHAATLSVLKDYEGLQLSNECTLLNMFNITAEYDEAWNIYFNKLGITSPKDEPLKGYSSWYNLYRKINENTIMRDLNAITALAKDSINTFQIDDGYQPTIGDITDIDMEKFPNGLIPIVDQIHKHALKAGLWICTFGVTKKSKLFAEHNDWLVKNDKGKCVKVGVAWGGFYALDIYNPQVQQYIKDSLSVVVNEWHFDLLKLDFLYCAATEPRNGKTRAMIMHDALNLIAECTQGTQIIGCGVPLMPAMGRTQYMRIGADCSFGWGMLIDNAVREMLSTRKTLLNTIYRRYLDKRVFLNDPDVFYLRADNISMSRTQRILHARLCAMFASVRFVSDNVGEYTADSKEIFASLLVDSEYVIDSVERLNKRFIRIDYTYDGAAKSLVFNYKNGETLRDN